MKLKLNLQTIELDKTRWLDKMDQELTAALEKGGAIWLNTIILHIVPVWSGASQATFLKLARQLNYPLTILGVSAFQSSGIRLGFQRSSGSVTKDKIKGSYTFTYETNLFHLVFNEYNDANANPELGRVFSRLINPGPYDFQGRAGKEFMDFAGQVRLPNPFNFIKVGIIQVR